MPKNRKLKKRSQNRIERLEEMTGKGKPDWAGNGQGQGQGK